MESDLASETEKRDDISPQGVSSEPSVTKLCEDVVSRCAAFCRKSDLCIASFEELKKFLNVSTWIRTKTMAEPMEDDGVAQGPAVYNNPGEGGYKEDRRKASTTTADEGGTWCAKVETNVTVDGLIIPYLG